MQRMGKDMRMPWGTYNPFIQQIPIIDTYGRREKAEPKRERKAERGGIWKCHNSNNNIAEREQGEGGREKRKKSMNASASKANLLKTMGLSSHYTVQESSEGGGGDTHGIRKQYGKTI